LTRPVALKYKNDIYTIRAGSCALKQEYNITGLTLILDDTVADSFVHAYNYNEKLEIFYPEDNIIYHCDGCTFLSSDYNQELNAKVISFFVDNVKTENKNDCEIYFAKTDSSKRDIAKHSLLGKKIVS